MNITLDTFSGQSFERLVRALAYEVFGTSACVFSPGPDGGRDMTVEGKIEAYASRGWDGYLVLQSKFFEAGAASAGKGLQWLKGQIANERDSFLDPQAGRRRPDYYIIVTNVALSGADGRSSKGGTLREGGYTTVAKELDDWKEDVGIRDYDIWPRDKIVDLLSSNNEVRRSFAAWTTPSDVLTDIVEWMKITRPDFSNTVRRSLITSLRRKEFAELKDAGSVSDQSVRTGQVFVDVPFSTNAQRRFGTSLSRNVVSELVLRCRNKYNSDSSGGYAKTGLPNKIVLLGGPGQGKSTISTYLAQLFRSIILTRDLTAMSDEVVRLIAPEIIKRAADEGIATEVPARYPTFISLPLYADQVSTAKEENRKVPTLLGYIADEIADTSDGEVSRDDLRSWLSKYPWLIVLDGLDEVPPSGERSLVIDGINGLTSEIAQLNADTLILLTTRPQGYNNDLNSDYWQHWELAELPVEKALSYTGALAVAKYPDDRPRRERIAIALRTAAQAPATGRLLVTPLQATILFLIVDTGGTAPTARWSLFNEYFEVLKRREKAKPGEVGRAIERNWNHLGVLHQTVGLILQVRSEIEGGAKSRLRISDVEAIFQSYFSELGFKGAQLANHVKDLKQLALHRLVLLTAKDEGYVQFDVRSLQEFMAAAAITTGEMNAVEKRLELLAGIAHWRHVWLIAASRCFADDAYQYRRLPVIAIPRALETSNLDRMVQNGSRLALELFRDGIGVGYPIARIALAKHAVDGLDYGLSFVEEGAASLWETETEPVVLEGVVRALRSGEEIAKVAAWALVWQLENEEVDRTALEYWPDDSDKALGILRALQAPPSSRLLVEKTREVIARVNPSEFVQRFLGSETDTGKRWIAFLGGRSDQSSRSSTSWTLLPEGCDDFLSVRLKPLSNGLLSALPDGKEWLPQAALVVDAISNFERNPCSETLTLALQAVYEHSVFEEAVGLGTTSTWPLVTLCKAALTRESLGEMLQKAVNKEFGDTDDWRSAESRWAERGISVTDIEFADYNYPFSESVGEVGAPNLNSISVAIGIDKGSGFLFECLRLLPRLKNSALQRALSAAMTFAVVGLPAQSVNDLDFAKRLLDSISSEKSVIYLELSQVFASELWLDESFCHAFDGVCGKGIWVSREGVTTDLKAVADAAKQFCLSQLWNLVLALAVNQRTTRSVLQELMDDAQTPGAEASAQTRFSFECLRAMAALSGCSEAAFSKSFRAFFMQDANQALRTISRLFDTNQMPVLFASAALGDIINGIGFDPRGSATLKSALKSTLDRRRSNLADRDIWVHQMQLPSYQYDSISWQDRAVSNQQ